MARDEVRLVGQRDAAFLFEHAQHRDGIRHDRRLGVFRQGQLILGAFRHHLEKVLAQSVVDFLEDLAGHRAGRGEFGTHADFLASLSRK